MIETKTGVVWKINVPQLAQGFEGVVPSKWYCLGICRTFRVWSFCERKQVSWGGLWHFISWLEFQILLVAKEMVFHLPASAICCHVFPAILNCPSETDAFFIKLMSLWYFIHTTEKELIQEVSCVHSLYRTKSRMCGSDWEDWKMFPLLWGITTKLYDLVKTGVVVYSHNPSTQKSEAEGSLIWG